MLSHPEKVTDMRGADHVFGVFEEIAHALGYVNATEAADGFERMISELDLSYPVESDKERRAHEFADSVNVERLGNNPTALDNGTLYRIYLEMFI